MKFRVTMFRERGRRLSSSEISNAPSLLGELESCQVARPRGFYKVASLYEPLGKGSRNDLAQLYEPELVQISKVGLFLRGIEKRDGRSFLQEWRCEFE